MDIIIESVVCFFAIVLLSKIVKEMKKKNFLIIEELADLIIAVFKTVFALTKAIIKFCEDIIK